MDADTTTAATVESRECAECAYEAPARTAPALMEDCPTPFFHGLYGDD